MPLLCANFRLLVRFLLSGVSLYRQVSPFLSSSPPASLSPSPTLKAAETPGIPAGQGVSLSDGEFDSAAFLADGACRVEAIPAEIVSTVGHVRRVGAVKIAVIRLLGEAIGSGFLPVIGCVVGSNLNGIAMVGSREGGGVMYRTCLWNIRGAAYCMMHWLSTSFMRWWRGNPLSGSI